MFSIKTHTSSRLLKKTNMTMWTVSKWVFLIRFSMALTEEGVMQGCALERLNRENKGLGAWPCEKQLYGVVSVLAMKRGLYEKMAQRSCTGGESYTFRRESILKGSNRIEKKKGEYQMENEHRTVNSVLTGIFFSCVSFLHT